MSTSPINLVFEFVREYEGSGFSASALELTDREALLIADSLLMAYALILVNQKDLSTGEGLLEILKEVRAQAEKEKNGNP